MQTPGETPYDTRSSSILLAGQTPYKRSPLILTAGETPCKRSTLMLTAGETPDKKSLLKLTPRMLTAGQTPYKRSPRTTMTPEQMRTYYSRFPFLVMPEQNPLQRSTMLSAGQILPGKRESGQTPDLHKRFEDDRRTVRQSPSGNSYPYITSGQTPIVYKRLEDYSNITVGQAPKLYKRFEDGWKTVGQSPAGQTSQPKSVPVQYMRTLGQAPIKRSDLTEQTKELPNRRQQFTPGQVPG